MAAKLSNDALAQLKEVFSLFDKNGDGAITTDELALVLNKLNQTLTEGEIKEIMTLADENKDGQLDFNEFTALLKKDSLAVTKLVKEIEVCRVFVTFDADKNGSISRDELREALKAMGKPYDDAQLDKLIKEVDTDGNGQIELNEFCKLYHKL
ncbi:hypothetical protein IWQ62_004526 [Dispira parvispora]|uniref:EF-hand domain-containing protein n=1 Tax=Dispira parvispora TaxID=1520584 RepID=A0A9W8ARP5_9FUNG|nr:hypothetical protein IWQ62_004526 [Dispira parvispora]